VFSQLKIFYFHRQEMVRVDRWLLFQSLAVNLSMVTIVLAFIALA